jgi:peroxiredoxin
LKWAYREFGLDVPGKNGADEWALPISATYVIRQDGIIAYAYTDADYRDRAEPADVLRALNETAVVI